jgi:hypothetical protein
LIAAGHDRTSLLDALPAPPQSLARIPPPPAPPPASDGTTAPPSEPLALPTHPELGVLQPGQRVYHPDAGVLYVHTAPCPTKVACFQFKRNNKLITVAVAELMLPPNINPHGALWLHRDETSWPRQMVRYSPHVEATLEREYTAGPPQDVSADWATIVWETGRGMGEYSKYSRSAGREVGCQCRSHCFDCVCR